MQRETSQTTRHPVTLDDVIIENALWPTLSFPIGQILAEFIAILYKLKDCSLLSFFSILSL